MESRDGGEELRQTVREEQGGTIIRSEVRSHPAIPHPSPDMHTRHAGSVGEGGHTQQESAEVGIVLGAARLDVGCGVHQAVTMRTPMPVPFANPAEMAAEMQSLPVSGEYQRRN